MDASGETNWWDVREGRKNAQVVKKPVQLQLPLTEVIIHEMMPAERRDFPTSKRLDSEACSNLQELRRGSGSSNLQHQVRIRTLRDARVLAGTDYYDLLCRPLGC